MAGASISNIIFYRTCVHSLNHTKEECKDFLSPIRSNATRMLEEDVQKYATFVLTVKSVMESVTPAILSMFLGVWSDTYGRKPLIVWPIFGWPMQNIRLAARERNGSGMLQRTSQPRQGSDTLAHGREKHRGLRYRVLSISDLVLAAVAFLSAVVEYTIKAIVVNSWQMYLSLSGPLVRSFLAKALPVEDIAKVFAMMCAIEGLSPLIAPILFNSVYVVTLENFPGTVYFISGGLSVVCVVLLGFVQYYSWNAPTSLYRPLEEDEEI
ncbi:unnamed protein product, partial [Iphiclides podalirius]